MRVAILCNNCQRKKGLSFPVCFYENLSTLCRAAFKKMGFNNNHTNNVGIRR